MGSPALLERDGELAALDTHAGLAFGGQGRLLFLGGEAGAGKTTLLQAFCRQRKGGATLLLGACDAMAAPRPLAPLQDFAAVLGEEFAGLVESGERRERIFNLLLAHLRSASAPQLLVFEDLHWADEATLDLLRYLGRRLDGCRTLLIGSYRDDEVGATHPLRRLMGDLAGAGTVHRLGVPPLSLAAVSALVGERPIDAAELHRRTGGNPFFVTEVLAAGGDGLPEKVGDAVLARVSRLPEAARLALELASVVGQKAGVALLERLLPTADAVDACLSLGLLSSQGDHLAFRHELAREAVLASMSPHRRRQAHAAVLAAWEAMSPTMVAGASVPEEGAMLAVLAHHAAEAGDGGAVLRYAPAAGRLARRLRANREARLQYARALPFAAAMGAEEHAQLLEEYAAACGATSQVEAAFEAHRSAAALWRAAGRREREAQSLAKQAEISNAMGRDKQEVRRLYQEAIDLVDRLPETRERAMVYGAYAYDRMLDRDTETALRWTRKAIASGRRSGNLLMVASIHNGASGALVTAERIPAAWRHHHACIALLQAGHSADPEAAVHSAKMMMGSGLGEVHRFREAEELLASVVEFSRRHDLDFSLHYATAWRALTHLHLGRWQEAGTSATWLLNQPNAEIFSRIMASVALGRLRLRRGDPEAGPVLDRALKLAMATDTLQRLAPVRAARAEAALAKGDARQAREEVAAVLPLAMRHRHRWFVGELLYLDWKAGGEIGPPDWLSGPYALQLRGRAKEAARAWQRMGCPFEQARALAETEEVQALRRAFDLFQGLGARPMAMQLADRLRQWGVRGLPRGPRKATAADPVGLTPRERQVLGLMAEGLRNVDIAARHRVSSRTVEHQVSAVLGKLGAQSRAEAVAQAFRLGLLSRPLEG